MRPREKVALAVADFFLVWVGLILALGLRVDFDPNSLGRYLDNQTWFFHSVSAFVVIVFSAFGLYGKVWRYAGTRELLEVVAAITVALVPFQGLALAGEGFIFPRTGLALAWFVLITLCGGVRILLRLASERVARRGQCAKVLIVGANDAGESVLRDLRRSGRAYEVVGFVDEGDHGRKATIRGVPIVGGLSELPSLVDTYEAVEVILAELQPAAVSRVVDLTHGLGVTLRTVPAVGDVVEGRVSVSRMREVRIEDLLEREPVEYNPELIRQYLHGKRVMVTGAGGSIGSEICRQVRLFEPEVMVLVGRGENSIYEIGLELGPAGTVQCICDVRNRPGMEAIFREHRPHVVFHAAAHKHVPLMEKDVAEAISNNVFGTLTVMDLCKEFGAEKFILLSTDKAVNPTSVMGATKRLAELLLAKHPGPGFAAVRFGNVLGSRGSVVPTFRRQIARGGPVTVTHKDMTRFFMTIPEAVALVLQAGCMARGGEIYVLDMGKQVRIVDLARNLIRLSGYEPDKDIKIDVVGVRPGEKMGEELVNVGEDTEPTEAAKILRVTSLPPEGVWPGESLDALRRAAEACDDAAALEGLTRLVRNFHPTHATAL